MFVLTLTDNKLLKFVLILGKSCVAFVWGRKVGLAQNPFYHTTDTPAKVLPYECIHSFMARAGLFKARLS